MRTINFNTEVACTILFELVDTTGSSRVVISEPSGVPKRIVCYTDQMESIDIHTNDEIDPPTNWRISVIYGGKVLQRVDKYVVAGSAIDLSALIDLDDNPVISTESVLWTVASTDITPIVDATTITLDAVWKPIYVITADSDAATITFAAITGAPKRTSVILNTAKVDDTALIFPVDWVPLVDIPGGADALTTTSVTVVDLYFDGTTVYYSVAIPVIGD